MLKTHKILCKKTWGNGDFENPTPKGIFRVLRQCPEVIEKTRRRRQMKCFLDQQKKRSRTGKYVHGKCCKRAFRHESRSSAFLSMRSALEASECTGLWFAFQCALSQGALCTCCFRVWSSICVLILKVTFEQRGGIKRLKHLSLESLKLWPVNGSMRIYWFSLHSAGWALGSYISRAMCDPDLYRLDRLDQLPELPVSRSSLETDSVKWALCTVAQRADALGNAWDMSGGKAWAWGNMARREHAFFLKHEGSPSPLRDMHV